MLSPRVLNSFLHASLQGYFDDLAKYLRVGPPLYFVVKDYNYRYRQNSGIDGLNFSL